MRINIVYKTINIINKKVYIGVHTQNILGFDGYLGSGVVLNAAIKKYGKKNFKRVVLKKFQTLKECFDYEKLIVNKAFVKSHNTYNISIGGHGSWDHCHSTEILTKRLLTISHCYNGDTAGQLHTPESLKKSKITRTRKYGSPEYHLHTSKSRNRAQVSRKLTMDSRNLPYNHYMICNKESIEKAKITRSITTRLRSISKYPELSQYIVLYNPTGTIEKEGLLIDVSAYMFGSDKGTAYRRKLVDLASGKFFTKMSKWYGYYAIIKDEQFRDYPEGE